MENYCEGGRHSHNQYVHIVQDFKMLVLGGVLVLISSTFTSHLSNENLLEIQICSQVVVFLKLI